MRQILYLLVFILSFAVVLASKQIKDTQRELENAMANVKAYSTQLDNSKKQNIAYQMTVGQLRQFGDSIMQELDATRRELGVKEKNAKTLQYIKTTFTKTDTILLKDTLFKSSNICIDTTLTNEWYSLRLAMNYPSTVLVAPEVKSEKYIVTSAKRETINPPKKFFLFRWFQKKHTVVYVDIVEKNPYIKVEDGRFVEIVK